MTTLREAAQRALERLRKYHHGNGFVEDADCIAALEAALAQQAELQGCATEEDCTKQPWCRIRGECQRKQAEPVEPVAWVNQANLDSARIARDRGGQGDTHTWSETRSSYHGVPLYAAPPQRKPLTEEEIYHATGHCGVSKYTAITITRAVERAHGIT